VALPATLSLIKAKGIRGATRHIWAGLVWYFLVHVALS